MLDGVYKIARDEGALALFSGSFARILFHVPNVAITMSLVEVIKPRVSNFINGHDVDASPTSSNSSSD
jgi:Mitochondrial carrier protein